MHLNLSIYISGNSFVHRTDARVKLILLLAYSLTLFFVQTWAGLGICVALCLVLFFCSRIPFRRVFSLLIPVYIILAFTLVFNSFTFDVAHVATALGVGDVSAGIFADQQPIPLIGSFGFIPEGFVRGSFYALRIVFLVLASFVVSFTTTSTALTNALSDFLKPLRIFHVPTDDIATMASIALRFIPVTAEEFSRVYAAQWVRGASFGEGSIIKRLKAWQTVLIPLFVGLFRRADNLALAMESRCYGMNEGRTELNLRRLTPSAVLVLAFGIVGLCLLGAFL